MVFIAELLPPSYCEERTKEDPQSSKFATFLASMLQRSQARAEASRREPPSSPPPPPPSPALAHAPWPKTDVDIIALPGWY